jgi:NAD(P)-dependent dehydrogenase (short-subunit alcohol dehydrogenase family)
MTPSLQGRVALVTGASRGLGYAAARALAAQGAHVIATARTQGGLEELDDAIRAEGGACTIAPMDLGDTQGIEKLAEIVVGALGPMIDERDAKAAQMSQRKYEEWASRQGSPFRNHPPGR